MKEKEKALVAGSGSATLAPRQGEAVRRPAPGSDTTAPPADRPPASSALALPAETAAAVAAILEAGTAPNTRRAYRQDLAYWRAWHQVALGLALEIPVSPAAVLTFLTHHLFSLPPDVEEVLVDEGVKARPGRPALATVRRRLAALATAHRLAGVADADSPTQHPQVRALLRQAARAAARRGERPARKRAATRDVLERMLATCDGDELAAVRDRALLLFGWASGGRRRSEIAAARVEDLEEVADGYLFHLRRSKTDPAGAGVTLPVFGRAGEALGRWLEASGVASGPLFRAVDRHGRLGRRGLSGRAVAEIVRRRAAAAGVPEPADFAGHSLRSGFATEAGRRGVPRAEAMRLTTHRSTATFERYYEAGELARNPAARLAEDER